MTLLELRDRIVAAGVTTPVRFLETPTNPDSVIVLQDYQGEAPRATLGVDGISTELPRIQVLVRGTDEEAVRLEAVALTQILRFSNQDLGGVTYMDCRPLQAPFYLRHDVNNRPVYAFNVVIEKELS